MKPMPLLKYTPLLVGVLFLALSCAKVKDDITSTQTMTQAAGSAPGDVPKTTTTMVTVGKISGDLSESGASGTFQVVLS